MKKILHVIDSFDLGGAQTFLLDLVRHGDGEKFHSEVAAMHGNGVFRKAFREAGIITHSLSPGKWPPFYLLNFPKLLMRGNFDILHFHLFGANLCAKPLAIAAGHRAIVVHDQCNDASRDHSPLLLAADALANRGAARIIAVSESVRAYLLDREDLSPDSVEMIPNGLDTEGFAPATAEQKINARVQFGIPESGFVIGGVGRLVPQKNFTLFLEVAAHLENMRPEVVFVVAGSGPLEQSLRARADELGISVCFLGHVEDRSSLYHALDALFMPSNFEGTPMALLEAMASGLPVVASGVDGIAEVCSHGMDALLVSPGKASGFVAALDQVIGYASERLRLGKNARQKVISRYDIRGVARRIEAIYTEVLAESL